MHQPILFEKDKRIISKVPEFFVKPFPFFHCIEAFTGELPVKKVHPFGLISIGFNHDALVGVGTNDILCSLVHFMILSVQCDE